MLTIDSFVFLLNKKSILKKIGLLSDTHGFIDAKIKKYFADVDEIWHAGDIGNLNSVTDVIKKIKPLKAVYGNIDDADARKEFPKNLIFSCEEVKVIITHICGSSTN